MQFIRITHPYCLFLILLCANVGFWVFRAIFMRRPPSYVREARECLHSHTPALETDEQFFRRMWASLHQVVDKCSYKYFRTRTKKFGSGMHSFLWLNWQVDEGSHVCNTVFIHKKNSVSLERELKRYTEKCVIYSVSESHPETQRYQDPTYSVLTLKQKMNPLPKHTSWGVDNYKRDYNTMDLVYFLQVQVHRMRYDSINIYMQGNEYIKSLFTKSSFDEANLATCQFNVIYDRPKTRLARREFRATWKRLLYDRRYLVTSVRRFDGGQKLSIFILNISEPYCWAKYISNQPFVAKNV